MIIATDESGRVWIVGNGRNASVMPQELNGVPLTAHVLTQEQETAFNSLPADRDGTIFNDGEFVSISRPAATPTAVIMKLERDAPFTHRSLREFFIGFGAVNPQFQATLLYQRAKAVDDAIKAERAKL